MLSADKLTVKAAEALQRAAAEARSRGNPEIYGVHLLHALLNQEEGIVVPILQKLEGGPHPLEGRGGVGQDGPCGGRPGPLHVPGSA